MTGCQGLRDPSVYTFYFLLWTEDSPYSEFFHYKSGFLVLKCCIELKNH